MKKSLLSTRPAVGRHQVCSGFYGRRNASMVKELVKGLKYEDTKIRINMILGDCGSSKEELDYKVVGAADAQQFVRAAFVKQ